MPLHSKGVVCRLLQKGGQGTRARGGRLNKGRGKKSHGGWEMVTCMVPFTMEMISMTHGEKDTEVFAQNGAENWYEKCTEWQNYYECSMKDTEKYNQNAF